MRQTRGLLEPLGAWGHCARQCAGAVYLRCGQRLYSFSFFHKLGTQAKRAENRYGEWIELFGFDDGRMPRYEMRQVPGVAAPFCGVLPIKCWASDDTNALIESARKECRSTHFVLVDAYQDLPDDFIMRALATPRDG
jgi:hypothetical protein